MPPKMKIAEGIVVIVDVGPNVRNGTENTFFNQSKECLINILQRKIYAENCKDHVGVLLFGTDGTENNLANGSEYQHITVLQEPRVVNWDIIEKVTRLPRGFQSGDWVDAIVVAMDMLHDPDEKFESKKIVLMTDFSNEFSADQTDRIIQALKSTRVELSIIGPDVDNDDDDEEDEDHEASTSNGNGNEKSKAPPLNWNGKPKTKVQLAGEALASQITSEVNGIMCSFDEAIPMLMFFQKKSGRSANWNSMLEIGPNFSIPITGRIKIKQSTVKTWKKKYAQDETAIVIKETSYHKQDDAQTPVEEEDVINGYTYGTTLVPFSEEDAQLHYNSGAERSSLGLLGFTRAQHVPLGYRAGDQVLIITAREYDDDAATALSAVINGMIKLNMVGITRKIYRKNCNPILGALYPEITDDYECLIWVPLPFQEDVRSYSFPSLKKLMEKITSNEREVMDELITIMDLSPQEEDDEELLEPKTVLNPQLQHFFNLLTHRALNPDDRELPPPQQHVLNILSTPEHLNERLNNITNKLNSTFPTKHITRRTKRDRNDIFNEEEDASSSKKPKTDDSNVSANDLLNATVTTITTATPAQDFIAMLKGEAPNYSDICNQMEKVILKLLDGLEEGSTAIFNKIIECLKVFRKEATCIDATPYNNFLPSLKQIVKGKSFNTLWTVIVQDNLGLITKDEGNSSKTKDDALEFLKLDNSEVTPAVQEELVQPDDYDDMLDDL